MTVWKKSIKTIKEIVLPLYLYSFIIQFIWEMVQMPFFADMSLSNPYNWLQCAKASLGDAHITAFIWIAGAAAFRDILWFKRFKFLRILFIAILGAGITLFLELHALGTGRWSYSQLMPVFPVLKVGVVPVVQMILLPIVVFRILSAGRD